MRAATWFIVTTIAVGCRPSATVENTTPVANLQSYRTVGLRVKASAFNAQGQEPFLEAMVLEAVRTSCRFDQVGRADGNPTDIVLDLNITAIGRGGGGMINNPNLATVETLLVLSDGPTGDLLGTARIRGKSSGIIINNARPEAEAVRIVAKTVANVLANSGCNGPRIAKVEPDPTPLAVPPTEGSNGTPPPDESKRKEADALNDQGKEKLRGADLAGALAAFQQANALVPDGRYVYNLCLTFEAQEQFGKAIETCTQAKGMSPEPKLAAKIDNRLDLLKQRK